MGLDTVKMNGDGFEALVNSGDKVHCGQKLIRFDLEKIKKSVESIITPIVITNSYDIDKVEVLGTGDICIGEDLMKVYK
ncbi:PTS sugar transporter subunit IIA [Clostridioides difficile]